MTKEGSEMGLHTLFWGVKPHLPTITVLYFVLVPHVHLLLGPVQAQISRCNLGSLRDDNQVVRHMVMHPILWHDWAKQ